MNIDFDVDRLFEKAADRFQPARTNPVTGGGWVPGLDPIGPQKLEASRALSARSWFVENGPPDAPLLPLTHIEREGLKCGGVWHIFAWFARSLAVRNYNFVEHPSFEDYACGVLASRYAPAFIKEDGLKKRYPPRQLVGLGPGLCWKPIK